MHRGAIEVLSEGIGKGSEFIVRLPLLEGATAVKDPPAAPPAATGSSRRILIADDNPDVLESFELMLQLLGHEVMTAVDGLEVLEKAEQFWPEVIVLDVGMPKLDGYETARRLRQQPWGRDAVLVALTGWGTEKDKKQSAEAGFNIHLVKPVDAPTIMKHLEKFDQSRTNGHASGK
jgi:CheY-like chemotaxis protein